MNYQLVFWIITAVTTLLRLLVVGGIGLSGDEAHYWTYTRYPDWSYFDHPPLVAWLIKLSTLVFGNTEFAVRFPTVMIFAGMSALMFYFARRLYNDRVALASAILLNAMPVFSFLGAVLTIPDTPLSIIWVLFAVLFYRTLKDNRPAYWYFLGALLGLGMLSKYNAVLLVPSFALFLFFSPYRFWLKRKEPYLALLIAGIIFSPVILWNLENNGASFGFQMRHGFGHAAPHFSLPLLLKNLGAQAGYLSPLLFILFWVALFRLLYSAVAKKDERAWFLFCFSFPTLFLFNAIASFNEILPHWPALGYLMLTIGAAEYVTVLWKKSWGKGLVIASLAFGVLLTVLVPLQAKFKVLKPEWFMPAAEAQKVEDGITKAEKVDITNELYGWREVGGRVAALIAAAPEPKPFVFTHRHYIASQLSFYIPGHPRVWCLSERVDAYDFWQRDLSALNGRDGIFVTSDYFFTDPKKMYPFASWQEYPPVDIYRGDRKVRIFWVTQGTAFDLSRLEPEYTAEAVGPRLSLMQGVRSADHRLFHYINRDIHTPFVDSLMSALTWTDTRLGVNNGLIALVFCIALVLRQTRRKTFWQEFFLMIGILGVGGIAVYFLKDWFGRSRPMSVFGEDNVIMFYERYRNASFPSGHTQIAFSMATYLTSRLKKYWWLFYGLALAIGLSRIYIGVHFPSDVFAGAVVGVVVALVMIKLIKIE